MAYDKNLLDAPIVTLERGMASSPDPRLIGLNQAALLINTTVRGGFPHPRPAWVQRELIYEDAPQATVIEAGRWQGAYHFVPRFGIPAIFGSWSGRQFRVAVWQDYSVREVTVQKPGNVLDPNPSTLTETWWTDTGDFLLMQDGQSPVWCYDGSSSRRLGPYELPVGCMMEYALGRVWVVLPDRQTFGAGDLIGESSGTVAYNFRDALLKRTINTRSFSVPARAGLINAVRYMPNLDTSLGQGPVQFFVDKGAFSVNAPFDSATWGTVTYPIQTVSLGAPGAQAQNSTIRINSDIWYRALDGIRSFIVARRDFTMWGNVPMSEEMNQVLRFDTNWLQGYGSAVLFDNRMLMTANPRWIQGRGVAFDTLCVMDFDLISSLGNRSTPAWDGMWTGRSVLQILTGQYGKQERCWAFLFNNIEGNIELWELTTDGKYDEPAFGQPRERIRWGGESRANDYGAPKQLKALELLDMEPASIQGTVDFNFKYRSDDAACWTDWDNFQLCATDTTCPPKGCTDPNMFRKSYRSHLTLEKPSPVTCGTNQQRPASLGLRHQIRWEITGQCELKQMIMMARVQTQAPFAGCSPREATCTEETCCPPSNNLLSSV